MTQELITFSEAQSLAETFAKSGYFQDARDMAQAMVKIMAGRELGIGPVASMSGVYIVKGKPALGANLLAGVLKQSGKYDYRVITLEDTGCEIAFFQGKQEIGRSLFTIADAKKAGTQNIEKFPRNMLFARAMTNGCRWYCPDVFAGGIYTPEELGAETDGETGEMINVTPRPQLSSKLGTATAAILPDFDAPAAPPAPKPEAPSSKAWQKWYALTADAKLLGVEFRDLDNDVSKDELFAAGTALKALCDAARAEANAAKEGSEQ